MNKSTAPIVNLITDAAVTLSLTERQVNDLLYMDIKSGVFTLLVKLIEKDGEVLSVGSYSRYAAKYRKKWSKL